MSLDATGLIVVWPYEPFAYNGFGWYEPAKSAQIDLSMPSLIAPDLIAAKKSGGVQAVAALESEVFPLAPIKKLRDGVAAGSSSSFLSASKNAKARFDALVASGHIAAEAWYTSPPAARGWRQYHLETDKQQPRQGGGGGGGGGGGFSSMHVLNFDENGDLLEHKVQQVRVMNCAAGGSPDTRSTINWNPVLFLTPAAVCPQHQQRLYSLRVSNCQQHAACGPYSV